MDTTSFLLLASSVILSGSRNLLSKNLSDEPFGTKKFFILQTTIFFVGALVLFLFALGTPFALSPVTLILAALYGTFLVFAQWNYTVALKNGKTGICSTVYSLGFILPTVFGAIFYKESLSLFDMIGLIVVLFAIAVSGTRNKNQASSGNSYFLPLIIAMLCSGGLGVLQKIQQNSPYANEKVLFTLLSFVLAAIISFLRCLFTKNRSAIIDKKILSATWVGAAFACCNLLNVILAGRLDSVLFYPILNIGTILVSIICGMIFFKEHFTKKDFLIFLLGITAILLICI